MLQIEDPKKVTSKEAYRLALIHDIEEVCEGRVEHATLAEAVMRQMEHAIRVGEVFGQMMLVSKLVRESAKEKEDDLPPVVGPVGNC